MIDTDHLERAAARLLAAPLAPPPPVHLVQARAARLRHRRRRTAAVATSAVLLVVVLLVGVVVAGGNGDGLQVRTVRPAGEPPHESGAPAPSATTTSPGGAASEATRAPARGDARSAASPAAAAGAERAAPTELRTEGCRVAARPSKDDTPLIDPTGADPGDSPRRCSFTATQAGGYEGGGTWTLDVVRDGRRTTYDSLHDPPCADDVIRPGDTVHVQLGLRAADTPASASASASAGEGEWHLAAGSFAHC